MPPSVPSEPREAPAPGRRWLLLVHHLPARPSNLRVRAWRRLQQLGAVALKQSVYVLPDSAGAREDLAWLRTEIEADGGEAMVFTAGSLTDAGDAELVELFRRARQADYAALTSEVKQHKPPRKAPKVTRGPRPQPAIERFRQQLASIEKIDFFGADGRDRVAALLGNPGGAVAAPAPGRAPAGAGYRSRLWVTRPRPGVDRMASAWLIRRWIDPAATFAFADEAALAPPGAVPFDMFGGDFSHHGHACTFEVLQARFGIADPAVTRLAAIVHDLDLKDERFLPPEAPTVGAVIDGLQRACADDQDLLAQGMTLFESLYRAFSDHLPDASP